MQLLVLWNKEYGVPLSQVRIGILVWLDLP